MKYLTNKGKILIFKIFIALHVLFISNISFSQNFSIGLPIVQNYQKSDYQAGAQNWSIVQGTNGIMYFGNNEGLLEFDGTTWRKYFLPNKTVVRSLAVGSNGEIYVGGQGEFGFFSPNSNGELSYHSLIGKIPEADRNFEDVWRIINTQKGVFFNTFKTIFQYKEGELSIFRPKQKFGYIFEAHDKIFVEDVNNGILLFQDRTFATVHGLEKLKNIEIVSILEGQGQEVIFITRNEGLFKFIESTLTPWNVNLNKSIKNSGTYSAINLTNNTYAVGTSTNGLIIFDKKGKLLMHLTKGRGFDDRTVLSLYEDYTGNLWAGLGNGIAYIELNSPLAIIDENLGVLGAGYSAVIKDSILYMGTNQAVFMTNINHSKALSQDRIFESISGTEGQTWNTKIMDNEIIIGQHDGTSIIHSDKIEKISNVQGAWVFIKINGREEYMLGGHYKGISLFKNIGTHTTPHWIFKHNIKGFDESARIIIQDGISNTFWIAHAYKGLYKVSLNDKLDNVINVKLYDARSGLPSNISNNVFRIKDQLVFTGEKNVFKYNPKTDRFAPNHYWNNILGHNKTTNKLIEDSNGKVWFVVNKKVGVLNFSKESQTVTKKTVLEKLSGKLMPGFEHIYPYQNGDVIFGTDDGFIYYSSNNDSTLQKTHKTLIRNVTITGQIDSTIYAGSHADSPIKLSSTLNNIKFSYAAIFYESHEKTQYQYHLKGFDNKWSKWTSNTKKEYTNLSNGKYIFQVKSKNIYGTESKEASYTFQILPPWYLSYYAYIAYVILGLLFLAGVDAISKKSHDEEKAILKRKQRKKLQKKEKEFNKIKKKKEREIIQLTNEKLEADIIHKNKELASTTMQVIHKNEFLIQLKDKLQGLNNGLKTKNTYRELSGLIKSIDSDIVHDVDWKKFEVLFDKTHEGFLGKIRKQYPKLSPKDLKLCSYLRMNLSTKEIAPLMNISVRGVEIARYRLRKKLEIDNNKIDLIDFVLKI